ncbi:MAG: glucose-1-phosphate adenylyltransferase family protein [Actinomycetes bacterium]
MPRSRILALIQAGGRGGRMDVLTRETPKPLLPFAGGFQLIDFPLSNLRNSGIDDVWLSVQYLAQAVGDAVGNGKAWDLDRHYGGFKLLVPQEGGGELVDVGFADGNAEELLRRRDLIREQNPDALVVMSADHVYRLDYVEVVTEHHRQQAECTLVTTEVPREDAGHHVVVEADADGRVTRVTAKPAEPASSTVATEVFVYSPAVLIEVLEELHRDLAGRPTPQSLGDFGEYLLPALVDRGRTHTFPLPGYWRDLGRPDTYVAAHRDLLTGQLTGIGDPSWPIRTNRPPRPPAYVSGQAQITDSLVSGGCMIAGSVVRSVLGPGVHVEKGATVRDCVLFPDAVVEPGAVVDWAVVADGSRIGSGARVGAPADDQPPDDRMVLLGRQCVVGERQVLAPGARLEPGTTA